MFFIKQPSMKKSSHTYGINIRYLNLLMTYKHTYYITLQHTTLLYNPPMFIGSYSYVFVSHHLQVRPCALFAQLHYEAAVV